MLKPKNIRSIHMVSALLLVAFIAVAIILGLYIKDRKELRAARQQLEAYKKDPGIQAQAEVQQLTAKVGQLIVLPSDEQPTLATVTDTSKLQGQPFFINAQSGDKVLIYSTAKKAILYRPSENRIIEVAPINIGDNTTPASGSSQSQGGNTSSSSISAAEKSQVPVKVVNASKVSGLARKIADKLKLAGYAKVTTGDAPQGAQAETTITYDAKYSGAVPDVKQALNGQGMAQEQTGTSGVTIVIGTGFAAE